MGKLPATSIEAEAVAFARQCIGFVRSGKLKMFGLVPGAWFEKGESRRASLMMLQGWILSDMKHLMDAIDFARAGYPEWENCLRHLINEFKHRREEMPPSLYAFDMELTRGIRFQRKAGQHGASNVMRDLVIGTIVGMVVEHFHLRPTRNPISRRVSACAIVKVALGLEGVNMSESNVNRCWKAMPIACKNSPWSQWVGVAKNPGPMFTPT